MSIVLHVWQQYCPLRSASLGFEPLLMKKETRKELLYLVAAWREFFPSPSLELSHSEMAATRKETTSACPRNEASWRGNPSKVVLGHSVCSLANENGHDVFESVSTCEMQWREAVSVPGFKVGFAFDEERHGTQASTGAGEVQRGFSIAVLGILIPGHDFLGQNGFYYPIVAIVAGKVKRRELSAILGIWVCTVVEENFYNLYVTSLGCLEERDESYNVLGIRICPARQESRDHCGTSFPWCPMQHWSFLRTPPGVKRSSMLNQEAQHVRMSPLGGSHCWSDQKTSVFSIGTTG